jgi:phage-related protein (TIGR01555 family)
MARTSIKKAVADAKRGERRLVETVGKGGMSSVTSDSFLNFSHKLGIGADNVLSSSSYGFNPLSRNRTLLEWIHRGSWIGGLAVDVVADDMTREGAEYVTEIPPDRQEVMDEEAIALNIWPSLSETVAWGRLYGGAIAVMLVDGQDMRTPLRVETVGRNQFRGVLTLDRWMVEPSLEDLVTDLGPTLGLPKYYRVTPAAPALRGVAIHHSRIAMRHVGVQLPYQQRLVENLWGISVLERLYDRMVSFDLASTAAAQLVNKSYLRTLSVENLRDVISAGGQALNGLSAYVDMMRRFQGVEGITLIDARDKFEAQGHSAFSGLDDVLTQLGQQVSGALQIPMVRLLGQSPAGLNSTGESDLRMYYDGLRKSQMHEMFLGVNTIYKLIARSKGIALPDNFSVGFKSLWQLTEKDKVEIGKTASEAVTAAHEAGLLSQKTALQELRQVSRVTGMFTNITKEMIDSADDTLQAPGADDMLSQLTGGVGAPPADLKPGMLPGSDMGAPNGNEENKAGPQGQAPKVDTGTPGRKAIQLSAPQRRPTSGGPGPGNGAGRTAA